MSRALRRQPLVRKPPAQAPTFRPSARPVRKQSAAAAAEAAKHRSLYDRLVPKPVRDIISELKKVSWPTREETVRLTVVVVVVSVAIGMGLGGVDIGFNWAVDRLLLR
ncbi:MAG TPA: preprotein translocase subunit SecE [Dehalococcoidia bacterium]|jgi:preprotein translocase subunit SecE|nr:preprotein translocase subunit SecE [Dehalococcoidia bacterium]